MPLPSMEPEPFLCQADDGQWFGHNHPYCDLPQLECHIAPLYAVIDAHPKCINVDLDQVTLSYYQSEVSGPQRELLCDIWALFEDAKEAAKAWEEKE